MKKSSLCFLVVSCFSGILYAQNNITNTLGTNGAFKIKDGSNDFYSLSQSSGNSTFYRSIELGNQTNSNGTIGVITKGGYRFIHNYNSTKAGNNTFVGINAGNCTMTGINSWEASYNTGVGWVSLASLTTGFNNSAFGTQTLVNNTEGNQNSAFGSAALYANTSGSWNTAVGSLALNSNTTGSTNSAFGNNSLYDNSEGYSNTGIGYSSLQHNSTGFCNTAVGNGAGTNVTTGSFLTILGSGSQPSSATATNEVTLGNSGVTALRCQATSITSLSDMRDKKNIRDLSLGLNFIMKLKPRQYQWDRRDWYKNGKPDGSKAEKKFTAGFVAQELDELQRSEKAEWLNLVLKSNPKKLEASPGNLFPMVVKAIQDQQAEIEMLRNKVKTLEETNKTLAATVQSLETLKKEMHDMRSVILKESEKKRVEGQHSLTFNERKGK